MTVRFSEATAILAELEALLEDDPETSLEGFEDAIGNAKDAIDRRAMFLNAMASRIEALKATEVSLGKHRKALERSFLWFMSATMATVKAHPEWTWQGDIHKFRVVKNGGKVPIAWRPFCKPDELDRIVHPQFIDAFPESWLETVTVTRVMEGFEDAVREGKVKGPLDVLPRGERLVIG